MLLTIFTPAYNRAGTLPRLYESLLAQSNHDFEWLIVDDGSTDETKQVVAAFTGDGKFPIRYYDKENGGKHTAYNLGLTLAEGDLFFCVDSDDYLAPGAVAGIVAAAEQLTGQQGIIAYKEDTTGKRLSKAFPEGVTFTEFNDLTLVHRCTGEFSLIFPTKLAQKFPFPVFEGERFVTESVVYDRISPHCRMLLLPEAVMICEYQADGYSQNANAVMARNPSGYCVYFMQRISLMQSLTAKVTCAGKYWCFRWMAKNKGLGYVGACKLLTYASVPIGLVFRAYYKLKRGF